MAEPCVQVRQESSRHSVTACPRPSGARPPRPTGPSPPRSVAFSVPLCHFDFAEWETRLQPGLAGAGHCAQLTCAGGRSSERGPRATGHAGVLSVPLSRCPEPQPCSRRPRRPLAGSRQSFPQPGTCASFFC